MKSGNILIIAFFVLLITTATSGQETEWSWLNPLPQGNTLRSVYFTDTLTGYVAGDMGTILKTTDGGNSWKILNTEVQTSLFSVFFVNTDLGYVTGKNGIVLKTTNGGINWEVMTSTGYDLCSIVFTGTLTGYAVGGGTKGTIAKTTNGGQTWDLQYFSSIGMLHSVYFINADTGYAVGKRGAILKTINGGNTWETKTADTLYSLNSVFFTDTRTGFAAGDMGTILKTTDGGNEWIPQSSGISNPVVSIFFTNADTGYALANTYMPNTGIMLKTSDGGNTWSTCPLGGSPFLDLKTAFFTGGKTGYIAGEGGIIRKTTDGCTSWTDQVIGTTYLLKAVYFTDFNTGYVAGNLNSLISVGNKPGANGLILKTTNGGATWNYQHQNTWSFLRSLFFTNANTGFAVGYHATILKTTDGGNVWNKVTVDDSTSHFFSVHFPDPNTGYAVGSNGAFFKTTDGGRNWEKGYYGILSYLSSVFFTSIDTGYVTATRQILKTTDGCSTLESLYESAYRLNSITFVSKSSGYAVGDSGIILKTTNRGENWEPLISGTVNNLTSVYFLDSKHGYVSGDLGTLLKTADGGNTWTSETLFTMNNLTSLFFTSTGSGFAVGSSGTILGYSSGSFPDKIPESRIVDEISVYPNPTHGRFDVIMKELSTAGYEINVLSIQGEVLKSITKDAHDKRTNIDITGFPPGLYLIRIKFGNRFSLAKVILIM